MISLIKHIVNTYFISHKNSQNYSHLKPPDNLQDLLARIYEVNEDRDKNEIPQLNKIEHKEGCFYKTGIVTLVQHDYLLIDEEYLCETKYVIPTDLNVGDKVYFMAYRKDKDADWKVRKIMQKIETTWEYEDKPRNNTPQAEEKIINGIVTIVEQDFILINNEYICRIEYVRPAGLEKGDQVKYLACKDANDKWKIRKILSIESKFHAIVPDENAATNCEDESQKEIFCKSGVVTALEGNFVQVNDEHEFERKNVMPTDLKVGDQVKYTVCKDENDQMEIQKIVFNIESKHRTNLMEQQLDFHESGNDSDQETHLHSAIQYNPPIEKNGISKKTIVGKIKGRRGREIFLEDGTQVDLDNISADFVPVIGDWVKLECLIEIDENVGNLQGEILEIEEMKPSRSLQKLGKVTEYDAENGSGMIDKTIVFAKAVCATGYIPCIGDKIVVHCIESDQKIGTHWRALNVVPMEDMSIRYETSIVKYKPPVSADEIADLIKDKENMEITKDIRVTLDVTREKEIEVTVRNNGAVKQTLYRCVFTAKKLESQLNLLSPTNNSEPQELKPSDSVTYRFKCKARFVGVAEELIIFKFKNFKVGRIIVIKVNSITVKEKQAGETKNTYARNGYQKSIVPRQFEDGMYIRGVKPYAPARFIQERPKTWKIPEILWSTMDEIMGEDKKRAESEHILTDRVPILLQPLNVENYKQRFDYLLYLEEIEQIVNMSRFDMSSAIMHRSGEFLSLNVPGLAEKRPSLIVGDRVVVSFRWDETGGQKCYEGFIHKIKSSDVFLKFNQVFHDNYHGEDCQVTFKGSTTVLQRCHNAINIAMIRLGQDFLFPRKVMPKEPQYNFVEADDDDNNDDHHEYNEAENMEKIQRVMANQGVSFEERAKVAADILNSKRIEWFNKRLNVYQREAVKNILKGVARPLPYVIFGPPGTGKTITVCESILQILFTMSESRILVTTPSNSSANLIAERLLKSRKLQPGDLVRLVAHHYLESDQIPESLIPYCATADMAVEGTRQDVNLRDDRGYQKNLTLSVLSRHRIVVSTCTAIGIMHNMGCKPGHFTHVVIDEAGQATEPEIMIPLTLVHTSSTQVILAGDPQQLGPVNQSRLAGYYGLNDSFLVRLLQQFPYQKDPVGFKTGYDPRLVTKLLMNYRSLPELLDLPNKLFYESELKAMVDASDSEEAELLRRLSDLLPKRLGDPLPILFCAVEGKNVQDPDSPSWYNSEEVTQVFIYLIGLFNAGVEAKDIGIITPYSKQVYKIRNLIAQQCDEMPKVGSVEEFQGQERKIIILSTVRTAESKIKDDIRHALGFVAAPQRLNVAITRARSLLIIIGSPKLLLQDCYWRTVVEYCKSRNGYCGKEIVDED